MNEAEAFVEIIKRLRTEESSAISRQSLALENGEINKAVCLAGQHKGIKIAIGTIEKAILELTKE